jgi:hypothetical protein
VCTKSPYHIISTSRHRLLAISLQRMLRRASEQAAGCNRDFPCPSTSAAIIVTAAAAWSRVALHSAIVLAPQSGLCFCYHGLGPFTIVKLGCKISLLNPTTTSKQQPRPKNSTAALKNAGLGPHQPCSAMQSARAGGCMRSEQGSAGSYHGILMPKKLPAFGWNRCTRAWGLIVYSAWRRNSA